MLYVNEMESIFNKLKQGLPSVWDGRNVLCNNALLPIALVNKTVSISDVPGSAILEKLTRNIE